jgi:histidyl-tRNA synthetase
MTAKVEARLAKGLRDLLPEEMIARRRIIETIRGVYELYGFVPVATPAIEHLDVLLGSSPGEEAQRSLFTVHGPDPVELGLRFDLTVPLARLISQYQELPRPFRRYQVAPVWRADKPDKGRFREFTQFDLDSVGVVSEVADTEILAGMCDTLEALRVGSFTVRFSSRGLLNSLLAYAGIPAALAADVFRVLDKLDKIGFAKVRKELTTGYTDASGDEIKGVGLTSAQVDPLERFLAIRAERRDDVVAQLRELLSGVPGAVEEIDTVARICGHLSALGYADERVRLDVSIARGLAYYTGPVFEAVLDDAPEFGSVFGGGRYDGLVERFLGERIPATGASIGVDRLLAALVHLGRAGGRRATARVLVTVMDRELQGDALVMTYELRRGGIPAELYLGTAKGVGKQLKYADRCGVPLALLYGSDEKARGVVTLKDLDAGRRRAEAIEGRAEWLEERPGQLEVPRGELLPAVRRLLARIDGEQPGGEH